MKWRRIYDYGDFAGLYGLALVVFLAGASKFFMPLLWTGFEPQWLQSLLPLTSEQFVYLTGGAETLLGLALASKRKTRLVASVICLWLLGITLTVASMGMWTIALRDLGLVVLAYYVAASH